MDYFFFTNFSIQIFSHICIPNIINILCNKLAQSPQKQKSFPGRILDKSVNVTGDRPNEVITSITLVHSELCKKDQGYADPGVIFNLAPQKTDRIWRTGYLPAKCETVMDLELLSVLE